MTDFTFGTDPEFMVIDKDGNHVSAIGIVPGTRDDRHVFEGHEFFFDNVLAEVAIKPGKTKSEVLTNIQQAMQHYADLVKPNRIKPQASQDYNPLQLKDREAIEAGCSADECAYELAIMEPYAAGLFLEGGTLRSGGGHVHLGTTVTASETYGGAWLTRILDLFLGIPSIFLDKDPTSPRRKALYGQPGRFRRTDYGIEYRTPGNFWLGSPQLTEIVYDLCGSAIEFMENDGHLELWEVDEHRLEEDDFWETDGNVANLHRCVGYDLKKLRKAITDMDIKLGAEFMEFLAKYLPKKLYKKVVDASAWKEPDLYKEWDLK